jgi:hypothetical protein
VCRIDPTGDTVRGAGATENKAYQDLKSTIATKVNSAQLTVDKRQARYDAKLATGKKGGLAGRMLNNAKQNLAGYTAAQTELRQMEASEVMFTIRMGNNIPDGMLTSSTTGGMTTLGATNNEVFS